MRLGRKLVETTMRVMINIVNVVIHRRRYVNLPFRVNTYPRVAPALCLLLVGGSSFQCFRSYRIPCRVLIILVRSTRRESRSVVLAVDISLLYRAVFFCRVNAGTSYFLDGC